MRKELKLKNLIVGLFIQRIGNYFIEIKTEYVKLCIKRIKLNSYFGKNQYLMLALIEIVLDQTNK